MEPEKIIIIVIVVAVCLGAIWAWCSDLNDDISCKVWAEQWDDFTYKVENLKILNEESAKAFNSVTCSTEQCVAAFNKMRDSTNLLVNPPVSDEVLTFEAIMSPDEIRKMIGGLDDTEELSATIIDEDDCLKDFTVKSKRVDPYDDPYWKPVILEEHAQKKLQPLLCKMCGGTVAKKGDIYECEYCGLKYEWR